jgi:hypothetical protein
LSGLNQIQIGFKNLLKSGFEKLEKEKEKEFFLLSGRFSYRSPPPRPAAAARFPPFPPPRLHFPSRAEPSNRGRWPNLLARASLPGASLTPRPYLSYHLLPQAAARISLSFLTIGESFSKSSSFLT